LKKYEDGGKANKERGNNAFSKKLDLKCQF
jgi:hypothetical protein